MKTLKDKFTSFFAIAAVLASLLTPAYAAQVSNVTLESNITGLELRTQQNDINAAFNTLNKVLPCQPPQPQAHYGLTIRAVQQHGF